MKSIKEIGLLVGALCTMALATRGCNSAFNNITINNAAYHTESYATGLTGHVEYTRYSNGSQDIKIYPGLSHRLFGSELHQDLNGDGLVDRIRQDGPEWKMHRLNGILVREFDYSTNKKRFDEADRQLRELMEKHSTTGKTIF